MTAPSPKKRILIVDDDISLGNMLKLSLERLGNYEVEYESSGRRGLATARRFRPDLILMDVLMPDADGGEIAFQIRQEASLKSVPIVFLTCLASHSDKANQRIISGGFQFLPKPITAKNVIACIKEQLANGGATPQKPSPAGLLRP